MLSSSRSPLARHALRSSLLAALSLSSLAAACNKDAPAVSAEPQNQAVAAATPAAAAAGDTPSAAEPGAARAEPARAKASGEGYDVNLAAKGSYEAGKPGEVEIVLVTREPFHVNDKYPYKFKLKESPGLKYANLVVGKEQVKLEQKRATVAVPFTPEKAGKHTVAGLFQFSVCTDDKCLIERQELSLDIEAK